MTIRHSIIAALTALISLGNTCAAVAQEWAAGVTLPAAEKAFVLPERIIPVQAAFTLTEDDAWVMVTLDGPGLGTATAVYANGEPVTSFSIRSQTRLVALLPATAGTNITVRTAAGLAVAWIGNVEE